MVPNGQEAPPDHTSALGRLGTGCGLPDAPGLSVAHGRRRPWRIPIVLLNKARCHFIGPGAAQVDILVSACSSVVLTPSLAAMVANRFGLRPDAATYALGGHGCTGGVLAIDLARRLMQARARAHRPPPRMRTPCVLNQRRLRTRPTAGQAASEGSALFPRHPTSVSVDGTCIAGNNGAWRGGAGCARRRAPGAWRWWWRASRSRTAWPPATTWTL